MAVLLFLFPSKTHRLFTNEDLAVEKGDIECLEGYVLSKNEEISTEMSSPPPASNQQLRSFVTFVEHKTTPSPTHKRAHFTRLSGRIAFNSFHQVYNIVPDSVNTESQPRE